MQFRTPLGLCAAAAILMGSCADNDTSLYVDGIMAGKAPECTYKADPGANQLPSGIMDVGFTTEYQAELLIGNRMTPRGKKGELRTESMGVQVRGAEVRLTNSKGDLLDEFSVPSSGYVGPSSSETPGFGLASTTLIPSSFGEGLRDDLSPGEEQTIVVEVRVFGETGGGVELTSGSTNFVVTVCHNCLRTVPEDDQIGCRSTLPDGKVSGCNVGQDALTDCRFCATTECASIRPWDAPQ